MSRIDDAYNRAKVAIDGGQLAGAVEVSIPDLRVLLLAVEEREAYLEALQDLVNDECEKRAIGGGPGWKERHEKSWARAMEFFEP